MQPRKDPSPQLLRLAEAQGGVVTAQQAAAEGVGRHPLARLVREGRWSRISRGVYAIGPAEQWNAVAWAGVLVGGDGARLGGRAAGYLAGLFDQPPPVIDIWVPAVGALPTRIAPPPYAWRYRSDRRGVRGLSWTGSPPRIRFVDVVIDLCAESSDSEQVSILTTAVQRRLLSPTQLTRALSRRRQVSGRAVMDAVLVDVADGAQSPLELRYLRDVERAHGLPTGMRQFRRRNTVADVLYRDHGLLVELDGKIGHAGIGRFRDMERDNRALLDGLGTLRYGWFDVIGRPCEVAAEVAEILNRLGWPGLIKRCSRCHNVPRVSDLTA